MISSYSSLRKSALHSLKGHWGVAIGAVVTGILITIPLQFISSEGLQFLLFFLISGPLGLGQATFYLKLSKNDDPRIVDIFSGFNNFVPAVATYLLMSVYVILWSLLLIVPGIIAGLSYSQSFYILSEEPNLTPSQVLQKSVQMMKGHKRRFVVLYLTFFGWALLSILTLGIGLLRLIPYMNLTMTKFYEDLKKNQNMKLDI